MKNYNEIQNIKKDLITQNNFLQSNVNLKNTNFKMTQNSNMDGNINDNNVNTIRLNEQDNVFDENLYNMEHNDDLKNESYNINDRVSEHSLKQKFLKDENDQQYDEYIEKNADSKEYEG